jgi:hypothetical protein
MAGIALEYNTLRDEVIKRIELRQHFVSMTLTIAGVFLGVGASTAVGATTVVGGTAGAATLVYPAIAAFIAIAWMQNEERIKDLAIYIRKRIERKLPGLGWETHIQNKRRKTGMKSWRFVITSHAGVLMLTQIIAISIGLLRFQCTAVEWILLGFDLLAVSVVIWAIFYPYLGFGIPMPRSDPHIWG